MKSCMIWLIAMVLVCGSALSAGARDPVPAAKPLVIRVCLLEGDPLGSREAGTLKVLAEPTIVTLENRPATFVTGGEIPVQHDGKVEMIPFGVTLTARPSRVAGGKVRLDVSLTLTTVAENADDRLQTRSEGTRTILTARLGEVVKLRMNKKGEKQSWVEIKVEEAVQEN